MTKDTIENLGTLLDETAARDAVHVAVLPVIAKQRLKPGEHVGLSDDHQASNRVKDKIGIVDPFLTRDIKPGDRFYLFLYPRTITSLRHVWSHPAVPDEIDIPVASGPQETARQWIENFAASIPLAYQTLMDGADQYLLYGDYLCFGGLLEGEYVPDEFWDHYETVTGKKVPDTDRGSFFTCSC